MSRNIEAGNFPDSTEYVDDDEIDAMLGNTVGNHREEDEAAALITNDGRPATDTVPGETKKKKLTKNQIALIVVVATFGFFALMLFIQMPSNPNTAVKSSSGFVPSHTAQLEPILDSEVVLELKQDISDLKESIGSTKDSANEAFESIAISLKNLQASNKAIIEEVTTVKSKYDDLLSNGNNKYVDQSNKIGSLQNEFKNQIAKVKAELVTFKNEQNNKLDIAKRKQYEVVSVVTGKALLREISSGKELRIEKGVALDGFGSISEINITGCITFESGERYTPLKGRCS
ncbi:hypothetical protein HNW13_018150 [Shewanella sp. BF02_Schw]|uniref:hypothetical protein n=1 Tax=Shewanella sp. BF02_Schw TaxID=394908 RepID=UPI001787130A|nr:hypothetical protein [Shewanella sp. BF02_Schw]MBO1897663.1 hypothetical protein [Shewanella sp. BF02_Schw]